MISAGAGRHSHKEGRFERYCSEQAGAGHGRGHRKAYTSCPSAVPRRSLLEMSAGTDASRVLAFT